MRAEKARAVVLSSRPLGEADRIVRLFTRELGRVDAVVKGVRKTTSRWGGRLEPFNVCDLVLHPGRSLYTVTQAQLVDVFARLRADREALTAAAIVCEAAAGLTPEREPEERVFALLRNTLRELDRGFSGRALESPLVLGALLKLLFEAGYLPVLRTLRRVRIGGARPRLLRGPRRAHLRGLRRRGRADHAGGDRGAARRGGPAPGGAAPAARLRRRRRGAPRRPPAVRVPHRIASQGRAHRARRSAERPQGRPCVSDRRPAFRAAGRD